MIIIAGFHGSGTSAITKVLDKLGISFPGPFPSQNNHENTYARIINEKVLTNLAGHNWQIVPSYNDIKQYQIDDKYFENIDSNLNWKDPRVCLTLPIWARKFLNEIKIIWVKRNPNNYLKTMLSSQHIKTSPISNNLPIYMDTEDILKLAAKYESYLQRAVDEYNILYMLTLYEFWYNNPSQNIEHIKDILGFCGLYNVPTNTIKLALTEMRKPKNV